MIVKLIHEEEQKKKLAEMKIAMEQAEKMTAELKKLREQNVKLTKEKNELLRNLEAVRENIFTFFCFVQKHFSPFRD